MSAVETRTEKRMAKEGGRIASSRDGVLEHALLERLRPRCISVASTGAHAGRTSLPTRVLPPARPVAVSRTGLIRDPADAERARSLFSPWAAQLVGLRAEPL